MPRLSELNANINNFFAFLGNKLKNFKNLSIGEQLSYSAMGMGLVLILAALVLFII